MKITNRLGTLLLSIFLILSGLVLVAGLAFVALNYVLGGLAIAAGVLLLVDR